MEGIRQMWRRFRARMGAAPRPIALLVMVWVLLAALVPPVATQGALPTQRALPAPAATRVGPTNAGQTLSLSVALRPRDPAAVDAFLTALYDPASPDYHRYLTPAEFTDRFFDRADRAAVASALRGKGLTVTDPGTGSLLTVTGSTATVERAFGVTLTDYRDTAGRVFPQSDRTPALDPAIAGLVTDVPGLDNRARAKPRFLPSPASSETARTAPRSASGTPAGCANAVNNSAGAYTPNQFATAYNFTELTNAGFRGEGETVALMEYDDYVDGNIAAFQSCFGTNVTDIHRVAVDGGVPHVDYNGGQTEVELDIEVIVGQAPHLSHLLVYEDPDNTYAQYVNTYQQIATDNTAKVVSSSWGQCEGALTDAQLASQKTVFDQMAAQGQAVFNASGDYGVQQCEPTNGSTAVDDTDIADHPYVTGVGGTTLTLNTNNTISGEVTWNDYATGYGASGGGISRYYARPSFQTGPGTTNSYSNGHRETPDLAMAADPNTSYVVYTGNGGGAGSWGAIGGTSAAAPLVAAGAALINQRLVSLKLPRLGSLNPTLYATWNRSPAVARDTTVGDNCYDPMCGTPASGTAEYPATVGYDMATGIGSLNIGLFGDTVITAIEASIRVQPTREPNAATSAARTVAVEPTHTAGHMTGGGTPTPLPQPMRH